MKIACRVDMTKNRTFVIPFPWTRFFFLGAMVRCPFFGLEDLREDEEVGGFRLLTTPWAIVEILRDVCERV